MGNQTQKGDKPGLHASDLQKYEDSTFLTKREIQKVFEKFSRALRKMEKLNEQSKSQEREEALRRQAHQGMEEDRSHLPFGFDDDEDEDVDVEDKKRKVPIEIIKEMPEFKYCPFRERIFDVFTNNADDDYMMSFAELLDIFSVFSSGAPRDIKLGYAFKIYDFDNDTKIGRFDMLHVIRCITGDHLTEDEIMMICDQIFQEIESDKDEYLTQKEFTEAMASSPDFLKSA